MPLPNVPDSSLTPAGFQAANPNPAGGNNPPAGMVPTYGAAGIFTGYAPTPVKANSAQVTAPVTPNPVSPVAPTTTSPAKTTTTPVVAPVVAPATPPATPPATTTPQSVTPKQGQFYYTQSTGTDGKPVFTYYDANGNVMPTNPIGGSQYQNNPSGTPNAGGNLVQIPSAPTQGGFTQAPQGSGDINTEIQSQTQIQQQQLQELNDQSDSAFTDYENKISQIENGTFPLTPPQQSLFTAMQQQFNTLRQQQLIANTAFTQGTQVQEARTGVAQGGTQTAMGTLQSAINTGIQKLSAIDTQASQALAQLQEGFQNDDMKLIQDSYSAFQTYATQKEKTLNDMFTATTNAEKDLRDFNYKTTQDNIANTLKNDEFTYQQKQDAIKNALAQGEFDEKTKTDLQNYSLKEQSLQLQQQANDLLQGAFSGSTPANTTLTNGQVDPTAQAAFLAKLPPTAQALVKGLDDYTLNPSSLPTRLTTGGTGLTQQQALALVKAYDPNYDQSQYAARAKYNSDFNSGAINTQRVNVNTAINHLGDMKTAADALAPLFTHGDVLGIGTQTYNTIAEVLANNAGDPRVIAYNNIANKVATEIAGAYGENTGGERSAQDVLSQINSSAAQKDSLIGSTVTLLSGLTNSMYQDYQSNMGKTPSTGSIIFPNTQSVLDNLQSKGIGVGVNFVPTPFSGVSNEDFLSAGVGGNSSTPATADPTTFFNLFANTQAAAATAQQ